MKVRLDFVTNSSSSSFIITVYTKNYDGKVTYLESFTERGGDYAYDDEGNNTDGSAKRCYNAFNGLISEVNEGRHSKNGEEIKEIIFKESYEGNDENGNDLYFDIIKRIEDDLKGNHDKENQAFYDNYIAIPDNYPEMLIRECIFDVRTKTMRHSYKTNDIPVENHTFGSYNKNKKYFDEVGEYKAIEVISSLIDTPKINILDSDLLDVISISDDVEASFYLEYHINQELLTPKVIVEYKDWKRLNFDYLSQSRLALFLMLKGIYSKDKIGPKALTKAKMCYDEFMKLNHDIPRHDLLDIDLFTRGIFKLQGLNNIYLYKYNLYSACAFDDKFIPLDKFNISLDLGAVGFYLVKYDSYQNLCDTLKNLSKRKVNSDGIVESGGIKIKVSKYIEYGVAIDEVMNEYNLNIYLDLINDGYALIHLYFNKYQSFLSLLNEAYVNLGECDLLIDKVKNYLSENKFEFVDTPYMLENPFKIVEDIKKGSIDDYIDIIPTVESSALDIDPASSKTDFTIHDEDEYTYKLK